MRNKKSYFDFFYGAYEFCAVIYIQFIIVYSTEIYNTKIRDIAIGYFFFIEKFGSITLLLVTAEFSELINNGINLIYLFCKLLGLHSSRVLCSSQK